MPTLFPATSALLITRPGYDPRLHTPVSLALRRGRWWEDPTNEDNFRFGKEGEGAGAPVEMLLTVSVHGNEQCGLRAFNALLDNGFFPASAVKRELQDEDVLGFYDELLLHRERERERTAADAGGGGAELSANLQHTPALPPPPPRGTWPFGWDTLTVVLGNPHAVPVGKRFVDVNLNRLFRKEVVQEQVGERLKNRTSGPEKRGDDQAFPKPVELALVPTLAYLISHSSAHLDVHSTSSPTPAFSIPHSAPISKAFCSGFPVDYSVQGMLDVQEGTTGCWAREVGMGVAGTVECGQHDDEETYLKAVDVIKHFLSINRPSSSPSVSCSPSPSSCGPSSPIGPLPTRQASHKILQCTSAVHCKPGFRYVSTPPPSAFAYISEGEVVARDDKGDIKCETQGGAFLIMPVAPQLVHDGEEAWVWGVEAEAQ
ncbi:hypothetical protein M427DRAFT_42541 [Gonapodya prolifera JEL478]|uniref:Succinylglutamate desuccinylase/Aspartoacylase catalytic domain-containing protein n=1 Tax=Gonapodya prolifera (strain JEL478) TaxID=1344416 RepID=A0A139AP70_GONPJ|nr:hypothetical protein M427DRAFT_42541 [Gonapodya prolifera JEL478]|eukprot:KXS18536.1 hypothetical protein M427DRAFT_42541 [Gonapodya prolifera JEL478]